MTDVLVVGAGPTGLTLACDLLRRGIPVRLIDEKEGPESYSRAIAIQARTLEVLEKIGVLDSFLKEGKQAQKITFNWNRKKIQVSLRDLDTPYPFALLLPQSDTEKILRNQIEKLGGKIEWKTRLIDLNKNEALLELPSGEKQEIAYPWIVGCDGAHSQARHALDLPFHGHKLEETFLIADVHALAPYEIGGPEFFLSRAGFGLLLPLPETHVYRLVLPGAQKTDSPHYLTNVLKERGLSSSFEVNKIDMISTFQIQRRHVSKFRVNSIFLAGDAAHIHSPFGGQGMNTSIQDALNLGWKLSFVIQGASSNSLLDTYESERLPVAKKVLKETTIMTRFLTFSQKHFPPLFYWGLKGFLSIEKQKERAIKTISELDISYSPDMIIFEPPHQPEWKGPRAGERAPDSKLADGKRLFELLKSPNFVLLLFSENVSFQEGIHAEYGDWIDIHVIKGEEVKQKYAAEPESIYLIRPDGYIGYRNRRFKTEEVISYLLRVFLPTSERNQLELKK